LIASCKRQALDAEFLGDTAALIRPDEKYNHAEAYELVRTEIIERL
jgi:hypothetical protein